MLRILGYICISCLLLACEPISDDPGTNILEDDRLPNQESWNSQVAVSSEGHRNVMARADYMAQFEKPREILFIGNVQLDFFNMDGGHTSTMLADTGRIDDRRSLFTATGNVIVESDSGMTLTTTELHWQEKKERIFTDAAIRLTSTTDTLYGIGFESDASLENWVIHTPTGVSYRELAE